MISPRFKVCFVTMSTDVYNGIFSY